MLEQLSVRLPEEIRKSGVISSYIEPFVGGGAFFFYLRSNFKIKKAYLLDINRELILAYKVIQLKPEELITRLRQLENSYLVLLPEARKEFFYNIRSLYNEQMYRIDYDNFSNAWIERAAYMIFLNKTCFNGLFRQNRKGEFNVPHGRYRNPTICDAQNIRRVSAALAGVKLIRGDFELANAYVSSDSFVYFDPPYRPLSATSNFTGYAKEDFNDDDQIRLARFFSQLHGKGARLMLSNSDPKASNPDDDFFDGLYKDFFIDRVFAKRSINCNGTGRGKITELIIRNY